MFDKAASAYTTLGFELIGLVIVLTLLGNYLDKSFGWGGWGVISGVSRSLAG